jgi:putative DNA primase/helicase
VSVLVDRKAPELTVIEPRPPEFSDEALALEFARRYAEKLRYVAVWGQWLVWDGTRWKRDTTLRAFDFARSVCREASAECNSPNLSKAIASAHTVAAIEKLAKADRRLAAAAEQWDSDTWRLNTPGGTIDLRTRKMREHRRDDYCTKLTAVAPVEGCPRWLAFLDRITGGDQQLVHFLRRVAGYALTGITRDQALFFLYGPGGNGKSVFVGALAGVMVTMR